MKEPKIKLEEIIYVGWEESEQNWEVRPDGCSLHLTEEDFEVFERNYWNKMPKEVPHEYFRVHHTGEDFEVFERIYLDKVYWNNWNKMPMEVPYEKYSRPAGDPVKAYVRKKLYEQIKSSNHGLRLWSSKEKKATKNKELVYGSERSGWVESE